MKRIVCWRTSNSNRFEGSSSDVTSDESADAATASGMILIIFLRERKTDLITERDENVPYNSIGTKLLIYSYLFRHPIL